MSETSAAAVPGTAGEMPVMAENTGGDKRLAGVIFALVTVLIWAAWLLVTRYAMTSNFTVVDISLMRFAAPFLFFAPVWLKRGVWPRGLSLRHGLTMLIGSGAFYTFLVSAALRYVPASHVGILLPGVMGIWAVLIAIFLFGERPGWVRLAGYGTVLAGVVLLATLKPGHAEGNLLYGYGLVSAGAFMWACYTHAMRRSGLGAVDGAAFIGFWSFLITLAVVFYSGSHIFDAALRDVATLFIVQGVLTGCVAVVTYGLAIRYIGSTGASAFGAMTPALTAIGGVTLLGEAGGFALGIAVALVIIGVMVASGVFRRVLR